MTSLHHIPYGEAWSREEIAIRKAELAEQHLAWTAVESVPVSESIKTRSGDFMQHIENYKDTIRALGAEGVSVVIYNFMPVLDWIRTDMAFELDDGSECLSFDPVRFAAFDVYLLERAGAEKDYSSDQLEKAERFFHELNHEERAAFAKSIIDVFPGVDFGMSIADIRGLLSPYAEINLDRLRTHLRLFLEAIIPVCEDAGVKMAIHPDDPPFTVLGLPRLVRNENDLLEILGMVDSPANGICFCTGSLSPREDNDLPGMVERLGHRINAFHLRSTQRKPDGSFYESGHLDGAVDMFAVVKAALAEMKKRKAAGRAGLAIIVSSGSWASHAGRFKEATAQNAGL